MQEVKQTFRQKERLKSRKIIEALFKGGNILHHYPFKVLYIFSDEKNNFPAQIAISVSKRIYKKAVERNQIKRKIKEVYRKNKHLLYNELIKNNLNLYFFVIYTAKENLSYDRIDSEMKWLIRKILSKQFLSDIKE